MNKSKQFLSTLHQRWFDSRFAVLRSQLRRAKLHSPRSSEVRDAAALVPRAAQAQ